ncbi:MAG TPA: type II toxin-antitoxin system VapC family toxin [Vicinamibacterales bacterium]|nr:type II toxin-antitoxin system VapC family toxin [Vicinamibacterales bacterium]
MIVLDASAVVELLLDTVAGRRVAILIDDAATAVHVPHLVDVEVLSVLRRFVREQVIDEEEAAAAIENLLALDLQRHSHEALLERAWALRKNVTAYDGVYVALAEALRATLVTCEARLGRAAGVNARIEVVPF